MMKNKLRQLIKDHFPELEGHPYITLIQADSREEAAEKSVRAVSSGDAQVLMKGNLPTAVILKAVLNGEYGLRTGKVLSHVAAFEVDGYDRLLFVTDAGMNIAPNLEEKAANHTKCRCHGQSKRRRNSDSRPACSNRDDQSGNDAHN